MSKASDMLDMFEKKDEIVKGNVRLVVKKKASTGEWVVRWFDGSKYNDDKSYYTDDKKDAVDTMQAMAKKLK